LSRKIALEKDGGTIDVWGNGEAVRNYIYINDLVDGIRLLMDSRISEPVNIGSDEYVSVNELVDIITYCAGKRVNVRHIDGPVGVASRNFSNDKIKSLGWKCSTSLTAGIHNTYLWIVSQIDGAMARGEFVC